MGINLETQDAVALLVVALAGVYLVRRGWRFYVSAKRENRSRCGGCSSCGSSRERGSEDRTRTGVGTG